MDQHFKLVYVDVRPIFFPEGSLTLHPGGMSLPNKSNIINVTAGERKNLLRMKNGKKSCFVDNIITANAEEKDNDDR